MHPYDHLLEQAVMRRDFVAAEQLARKVRSRAVGAAIARLARDFLAFAFRFIWPAAAGDRPWRNAVSHDDTPPLAGRWISPKAPLVLTTSQPRTVFCDAGTVWVTQGDGNDFVLNAGEKLTLRPVDKLIVTAMTGPALVRHSTQPSPQSLLTEKERRMDDLMLRERELVALGAALASNCQPCVEFHIPAARKAGLSDIQISEAIRIADKVRQVPAAKVLNAAPCTGASTAASQKDACCA